MGILGLSHSIKVSGLGDIFHTRVANCMLVEALEEYAVARDSENY